jgi:hypothetical protein
LEEIERMTFAMVTEARARGNAIIERECVKTHSLAAANLLASREKWRETIEHERTLVSGEWVRKEFTHHDAIAASLVRSMPRNLAARILPADPDFAESELRRWAEDVFMKTLNATNPFHA